MKSSSCVLVVWLLSVFSLGRAQIYEGYTCTLDDGVTGVCRPIDSCPSARDLLVSGVPPKICMFANNKPIVCCRNVSVTTTATTRATRSTNRATSTTTREAVRPTKRPMVDSSTKAGRKCREYEKYVYWETEESSLSLFPEKYNKTICAMILEELIVGGVHAVSKEFPHMAALGYGKEDDKHWLCGGTLISERYVLTVGHCLHSPIGSVRWVRLGDLNLNTTTDDSNPEDYSVSMKIKHPDYDPPNAYNDIALLKLDRNVIFTPYIRPACLHTVAGDPVGEPKATATGWGKLDASAMEGSNSLMKVDLSFEPASLCNTTYQHEIKPNKKLKKGITPESMICAGDPKGKKDTCGGDSGAPLQIRLSNPDPFCMYSIVGLTSFGVPNCGRGGKAAVYTRVSNYIPWIENVVWP